MMRRVTSIFVALFVGVMAAVPAHASTTSEALFRSFVSWLNSSPVWSATIGDVSSSGRDTVVEGLVISRTRPDMSFSIEKMRIRDLHAWNDGFDATGVWFNGIGIVTKNLEYAIPSGKVELITMPAIQGLVFDPRHVMSFFAKIYSAIGEARFSNFSAPEIRATSHQTSVQTGETISAEVTYHDFLLESLSAGVLGRISTGPIETHMATPGGEFDITVQSASSEKTDLGALAHVFDPDQYVDGQGDGQWQPISSNLVYSGISGSGADGLSFKLDQFSLENISGRQLDKPFTHTWDQLLDMTTDQDSKTELALELTQSYDAWRLGAFKLAGLSVNAPAQEGALTLDDLTMNGVSSDGMDSLELSGLNGSAAGAFVKLGTAEMTGFVAPDLNNLLTIAAIPKDADPKIHAEGITKSFAALPRIDHLSLQDASGGKSQAEAISLDGLSLDLSDWNDIFAEATDMKVTGLKVPPQLLRPEITDLVHRLGYDDLVIDLSLSDRWSAGAGTDNAVWTVSLQDGGDMQLTYGLTGLTRDWLVKATAAAAATDSSQDAVMAMFDELKLKNATLSITDHSLLERAFGFAAQVQSLDVDGATYLKQMRAAFPFLISAALPPALSRLVSKPVQGFLAGGQRLVAEIAPASPVNLEELRTAADDPMSLPEFLDLRLRSETPTQ